MIGVDASIANAFRRILLAEIPTMAIERVFVNNNTGVIQDEVLAHRVGLIPIKADPKMFEYAQNRELEIDMETPQYTDKQTILFQLKVACTRKKNAPPTASDDDRYEHHKVTTADLVWVPQGNQAELFRDQPLRPVHQDILISKLRPGQCIDIDCYCEKNIGKEHAKWSPVSTASYRLMPEISFKQPVLDEQADALVQVCPMGVFDIEELASGGRKATVSRPRACTMCRECIRDKPWADNIKLQRVKEHFIFSIESTGIYSASSLLPEAARTLGEKCRVLEKELEKLSIG